MNGLAKPEPEPSGSVALKVATVAPAVLFSARLEALRSSAVGASFTSEILTETAWASLS